MKLLATVLLVIVVGADSALGAAGRAGAPHSAAMPLGSDARNALLVAGLRRVLEDVRPARYHLSRAWRNPEAAAATRGLRAGFGRPDPRPATTGLSAEAVGINPWAQQGRLSAGKAASGDMAGFTIALSGDTALVGAPGKNGGIGTAYVYVDGGTRWVQQARLSVGDGIAGDQFGYAVALSGDTALVGAPFTKAQAGAAYVFVRRGTHWYRQARLVVSEGTGGGWFGAAVALSGSTAVIGAPQESTNTGAAYVFVHGISGWRQQAVLKAAHAIAGDDFGSAVALSGDSALVGAPESRSSSGAVYVFARHGARWPQNGTLGPTRPVANDEFGMSVALSGSTALVGVPGQNSASGATYVFMHRGTAWHRQATLIADDAAADDNAGLSVALSGRTALVGAPGAHGDTGAMYVFEYIGSSWHQHIKLTAGDAVAGDEFGTAMALHGNTVLVGAPRKSGSGTIYVLMQGGASWSRQAGLTASDAMAGAQFSFALATSGSNVIVGAPGNDSGAGTAYVFMHNGSGWLQQARLSPGDGMAGDRFGFSVALNRDTAMVGAPQQHGGAGAAYVFVRSGTGWRQQAELNVGDGEANDQFGFAVALSGDTALIAAPGKSGGMGAVYVFVHRRTGWRQQARLSAGDGAAGDQLGFAVALSGATALIGAPGKNSGTGAAYVFMRQGMGSTANWRQRARLTARDSLPGDELGTAVGLSENTVLVGAGAPFNTHAGAAYVFVRNGTGWAQQARLGASDGAVGDQFGLSVALSGNIALVGAPFNMHAGAAYVFVRSGTRWHQQVRLSDGHGAAGNHCGLFVALGGTIAFVGAPGTNGNIGAVYVFTPGALH